VTRVLIVDDDHLMRAGLVELLSTDPGIEIVGQAATGRQAVELAKLMQPHVAVLDLIMPDLSGLEATRQIRRASPTTEVLIFTMHQTEELVREALSAGARGYLMKSDAETSIVSAVETLLGHRPYFASQVSETLLAGFLRTGRTAPQGASGLFTPREREVVQLLAEGRSNKKIALQLGISVKTVETHRATIMRKLGVNSIVEIVRYAVRNNLTEP
jgi:DNA-binding NarL/FixJ family response regulator